MSILKFDTFTEAYIECALWSSSDGDRENLDEFSMYDGSIDDRTLERMKSDCEAFQRDNADLLSRAGTPEQNGHDFWLTRNGHGSGFWDRDYKGNIGRLLTIAAETWREFNMYVGDDGKVYGS